MTSVAIAILLGSFFVLILLRMPISFALIMASVLTCLYMGLPVAAVAQRMVNGVNKVALLAVPFFIFAGQIMGAGGISQRLVDFSRVLVGRFRGGLAMVNVLTSMFFGGISGSSVADTSSIGSIMIPIMKRDGYDADYSTSVTIASSTQGILIPPSHNMIIYALAAGVNVSVGMMFLGGLVPGLILGLAVMLLSYVIAVRRNYPKGEAVGFKDSLVIIKDAFLGLLTPLIIVGGVITGVFTATESAAIACVWAYIVTFFIYREIPFREMTEILKKTFKTLIIVLPLIAAANAYGWLLAYLRMPKVASEFLLGLTDNKFVILFIMNCILLVLGCIMDMAPLILIGTPILLPVAMRVGMHPVHFGIMMMLNLAIGLITPPVGVTLFVGSTVGKVPIEKLFRATIPFYLAMVAVLIAITYIPGIVMLAPTWIMK
jgi:tripartite ATP-independent transporter DctM subunit